jgi:hypothetical protein
LSKPKVERIGEMDKVTFKKIQGNLTMVAIIAGGISLGFAVDSYNLIMANDFSEFGYTVMPWLIGSGFSITAVAVLAKLVAYSRR